MIMTVPRWMVLFCLYFGDNEKRAIGDYLTHLGGKIARNNASERLYIIFKFVVEAESKRLPSLFVDDFAVLVILFESMGAIMMRGRDADYSARSIVRTGICPVGIGPGSGTVAICFERHDLPSLT